MEERYGLAFVVGAGLVSAQLWRDFHLQVINIGTLDKPEEIEVSMHYYSDEALLDMLQFDRYGIS